jgi:4-hydroxy-tetrahydrodipicolinate synthase
MIELQGVVPMLVTPMRAGGTPDLGSLRQGAHGLTVLGLAGEGTLLAPSERQAIAETLTDAVAGRAPVLIGITAEMTADAIALGTHTRDAGSMAVMLTAPSKRRASPAELREHFLVIANAVRCPLMIPDAPAFLSSFPAGRLL